MLSLNVEILVDPTLHQFDELAEGLKLDVFKLTVKTIGNELISIAVETYDCSFNEYIVKSFVQMERHEGDPAHSALFCKFAEEQGLGLSKACPIVAYRFVPYHWANKRMSQKLKKFALTKLHLDQCASGIEIAMKVLGFDAVA